MTPDRDESRVREEEDAAAAEAGKIGGRSGMEEMDEAERAAADPLDDRPAPEAEPNPSVHGEPDEAEPRDT